MGQHLDIATALAAKLAAITGMAGASATPLDSVPGTPYAIVGPPAGQLVAGNWEFIHAVFPVVIYIARTGNPTQAQTDASNFLDLFIAAFRTGITLALNPAPIALLRDWNLNRMHTLGLEDYQTIDANVSVDIYQAASYTP